VLTTFTSAALGSKIKWNPSVKMEEDRLGLLHALKDGKIDIIASDHAPHTIAEKKWKLHAERFGRTTSATCFTSAIRITPQRRNFIATNCAKNDS